MPSSTLVAARLEAAQSELQKFDSIQNDAERNKTTDWLARKLARRYKHEATELLAELAKRQREKDHDT